jgi:hypothetical protein
MKQNKLRRPHPDLTGSATVIVIDTVIHGSQMIRIRRASRVVDRQSVTSLRSDF